jgi:hypothetical protein
VQFNACDKQGTGRHESASNASSSNLGFLQGDGSRIVRYKSPIAVQALLPLHGCEEGGGGTGRPHCCHSVDPEGAWVATPLSGRIVVVTPYLGLRRIVVHLCWADMSSAVVCGVA